MEEKKASGPLGPRRRRGIAEETPYVKYLKYRQTGFAVSSPKTLVWAASKDKDKVYEQAEVLKDDGKTFSYRTEEGEVKIQTKI